MRTIALHGSYHTDNYGDLLLLTIYRRWLLELQPSLSVLTPFLSRPAQRVIGGSRAGWRGVLAADALVYAGGGYFGEPSASPLWAKRNLFRHVPIGVAIQRRRKPYAVLAVGVGPITDKLLRHHVIRLLDGASVLSVRDDESRDFLASCGMSPERVRVTADAALSLQDDFLTPDSVRAAERVMEPGHRLMRIGVHVSVPPESPEFATIAAELSTIANARPEVTFYVLTDSGAGKARTVQQRAANSLCTRLGRRAILVPFTDLWTTTAVLGQLGAVVTTKLHVGIVATALRSISFSLYAHQKTPRLYRQIGAPERCIDVHRQRPGELSRLLEQYLEGRWSEYRLPASVIDASLMNRRLLGEFLQARARRRAA